MGKAETLDIIKESFENWYNRGKEDSPVAIVINYSDAQTLAIKAYHKATIEMVAIGIREEKTFKETLFVISENYNHGVTSEQEAKDNLTVKLLERLYSYS